MEATVLAPAGLGRLLVRYVAVVAAAASALLVLDAVPWLLTGTSRGVVTCRSVEEAERLLGAPLAVPAYFPQAYRWPPAAILVSARPRPAAALTFAPAVGAAEPVLFVQTPDPGAAPPERLLPKGKEIHAVDFDLGGTAARMSDVLLLPDGTFHDITFVTGGRRFVFRFRGDPEEVLKMARSLARGGAR